MLPSLLLVTCLSTALSATAARSSESQQRVKRGKHNRASSRIEDKADERRTDYGYGYDFNYDTNAVQPATNSYDANAVQPEANNYEEPQKWEDKTSAQEWEHPNAQQDWTENTGADGWKDESVAHGWKEDDMWSASDYDFWFSESGGTQSTGSASAVFTQTGVGAKVVSSSTVTDLATIVTPTASQSVQAAGSPSQSIMSNHKSSPAPTPLALNQEATSPTATVTGVNAKFVCSTVIGVDASAAATKAVDPQALWPAQVEVVDSVYAMQMQPAPTPIADVSRSPLFVPASGVSNLAPIVTTTGMNAVQRGFVTITTSLVDSLSLQENDLNHLQSVLLSQPCPARLPSRMLAHHW
jgi:hypothetical protein